MKNTTILLAFVLLLFTSCDVIERPFGEETTGPGGEELPLVPRSVLLEEFTGFKCANCPLAADLMKDLKKQYEGRVELLTIHWGDFANVEGNYPNEKDLKVDAGGDIHDELAPIGYPLIAISRYEKSGKRTFSVGSMEPEMLPILFDSETGEDEPDDELTRVIEYSDVQITTKPVLSGNKITIDTDLLYLAQSGVEDHLVHYIVEDSIVAAQLDGRVKENGGLVENYIHTNVLRDDVNGTWGQPVSSSETLARGDSISFIHDYTIANDSWNKDKLYVLTLVTDGNAGLVKHVIKNKVSRE